MQKDNASSTLKFVTCIVLGVFLFLAGVYATGPVFALQALKNAILAENQQYLREHIDFPVLRRNLTEQFHTSVESNLPTGMKNNPLAAMASNFASSVAGAMVESLVTPQGVLHYFDANDRSKLEALTLPQLIQKIRLHFNSITIASIAVDKQDADSPRLIFQQSGMSWKLVNIEIGDIRKIAGEKLRSKNPF